MAINLGRLEQQLHGTQQWGDGTWSTVQNLCQQLREATQLLWRSQGRSAHLKKQFTTPTPQKRLAKWSSRLTTLPLGEKKLLPIATSSENPPLCNLYILLFNIFLKKKKKIVLRLFYFILFKFLSFGVVLFSSRGLNSYN